MTRPSRDWNHRVRAAFFAGALLLPAVLPAALPTSACAAIDPKADPRATLGAAAQKSGLATNALQLAAPRIIGVVPREVEIGGKVQFQLARAPRGTPRVMVAGTLVRVSEASGDGLWWGFELPAELGGGSTVQFVVSDLGGTSAAHRELRILPLRMVSVRPSRAGPGDRLRIQISSQHPYIREALVWFDSTQAEVREAAGDSIIVSVPEGLAHESQPRINIRIRADEAFSEQPFRVLRAIPAMVTGLNAFTVVLGIVVMGLVLIGVIGLLFLKESQVKARRAEGAKAAERVRAAASSAGQAERPAAAAPPGAPGSLPPIPDLRPPDLPELRLPEALIDACARGECVLYAGSGLSASAGLPPWRPFVSELLDWTIAQGMIELEFGASLRSALDGGDVNRVADSIVSRVTQASALEALAGHIRETFRPAESGRLPEVLRVLPRIGFGAVLTTNFDRLLERSYEQSSATFSVRLPADVPEVRGDLASKRFFILKLYGDLDRPDSLILSSAQYEEAIQGDRPFADVMQEIFLTRTIVFLGCSLEGIDDYLRGLRFQAMSTPRHFALAGVVSRGWEVHAETLQRRYGIQVLPYLATGGHESVLAFVQQLRVVVADRRNRPGPARAANASGGGGVVAEPPFLKSIELRNIGPFEHLELEFDRGWTILLGDNGVGKSTVIKSIALAVAGEAASAFAGRLLKYRAKSGEIKVKTTTGTTYVLEIFLNSLGRPEVRSIGPRAFAGETLVMGFPPTRFIAAGPTRAPQEWKGSPAPTPQDVLPLISGQPDARILEIKQWIVNVDYQRARADAGRARVLQGLLDGYFNDMSKLLDLDIKGWRIAENEALVTTFDGELPMDALSQGTVSIFGWVGALLQRQFDIQGRTGGPAIVLVDEIDAHMHPEWQQAMVSRLRTAFPQVQFVVSTHSPFLAIGRSRTEIVRLARDRQTGTISVRSPSHDTRHASVSSVLTGPLFGLQSQVDSEIEPALLTQRMLSRKENLTEAEVVTLNQATQRLAELDPTREIADPAVRIFYQELEKSFEARPVDAKDQDQIMQRQADVARKVVGEMLEKRRAAAKGASHDSDSDSAGVAR